MFFHSDAVQRLRQGFTKLVPPLTGAIIILYRGGFHDAGAGWPDVPFTFSNSKVKLFLLRPSLSLHGCLFDYPIGFLLRVVYLIILEVVNPKKRKKSVALFWTIL